MSLVNFLSTYMSLWRCCETGWDRLLTDLELEHAKASAAIERDNTNTILRVCHQQARQELALSQQGTHSYIHTYILKFIGPTRNIFLLYILPSNLHTQCYVRTYILAYIHPSMQFWILTYIIHTYIHKYIHISFFTYISMLVTYPSILVKWLGIAEHHRRLGLLRRVPMWWNRK